MAYSATSALICSKFRAKFLRGLFYQIADLACRRLVYLRRLAIGHNAALDGGLSQGADEGPDDGPYDESRRPNRQASDDIISGFQNILNARYRVPSRPDNAPLLAHAKH